MKSNIQLLVSIIILFGISLNACKNKSVNSTKTKSDATFSVKEKNKDTISLQSEHENPIVTLVNSKLRPNKNIELNKVYTDTVKFIHFNDNYDYWYFLVKKSKDTVHIVYADDSIHQLANGDEIVINWEIKQLQEAGDNEIVYTKHYLVSFKKIESRKITNKSLKVLWRENKYDEELKAEINTIILNNEFLENITQPEKAALGYVATFIGNECEWDVKPNKNRSNLNCQILSALGLGYQCSNTHLGFLRKWFLKDTVALKKLETCPTIPNTATQQTTFNEILIETNTQQQTITIRCKISAINTRTSNVKQFTSVDTFKYTPESVVLIDSKEKSM